MRFSVGDLVSRNSYNNDLLFKIVSIDNNIVFLKGFNIRLYADCLISDLKKESNIDKNVEDNNLKLRIYDYLKLNRDEYFYIPGKVLHVDSDEDYLERCLKLYKEMNVKCFGICMSEKEISLKIKNLLEDLRPDIVVITGHDAFLKSNDKDDINNYRNSKNFIKAVNEIRKFESSPEKLIVIAGACQSAYEDIIKAGANFASSPKRINIHCLDPAIIASSVALSKKNEPIDLISILDKTKFGCDGIGGIVTNGSMYVGYPR